MCRLKMTKYGISYWFPWSLVQQKLGISGNHFIPFVSFVKFVIVTHKFDAKGYIVYSYYLWKELYDKINTRKYNLDWNKKWLICQHYQHCQLGVITEKLNCLAKVTHFTVIKMQIYLLLYFCMLCVYKGIYLLVSSFA